MCQFALSFLCNQLNSSVNVNKGVGGKNAQSIFPVSTAFELLRLVIVIF